MELPRFFTVKQSLASQRIDDVAETVTEQLETLACVERIRSGQRVAISIGSRGIDRIAEVTAAVASFVKARNALPFVVPAMGSHGGATAEGQMKTLAALGVNEQAIGCPVVSSMDTIQLGTSSGGIDLFFDAAAAAAKHVIVVNRIKPHTRLTGSIQSGLCKMMMIGLGKRRGAVAYHPAFHDFDYRLDQITGEIIPTILRQTPILAGVAIVENARDSIGKVVALAADDILAAEPELLQTAIDWMPKLPFEAAELLIVDTIGKEISGTGLDTNVVGRKWNDKMAGPDEHPKIHEIFVRSLTQKTAGNASGIGIAEYTHRRVAKSIDVAKTRINCITAGHPTGAALPVWFDSDQDVLAAVCAQSPMPASRRRWMRIVNTLDLLHVQCSEGYLDTAINNELEIVRQPATLSFDPQGDLVDAVGP